MLRAVVFDMDGVIIDSHPAHKKAWKRFLDTMGREISDADLEFVLEGHKREDILRYFLGDLTEEQVREYGQRKEALFREEALSIETIPGLLNFMGNLEAAGIPAAVASSGSSGRVAYILDQLQIHRYIKAVVTGDDVRLGKPDPAIFHLAAKKLSVSAGESLVIEDAVAGVQAAKAAGMHCMGIASDDRRQLLLNAGADCVVRDFTGLTLSEVESMLEKPRRPQAAQ